MIQDAVHAAIVDNCEAVESWFKAKRDQLPVPFYASFDIRDSGQKAAPVDANIFPAGFNNICAVDRENAVELVREYVDRHYSVKPKTVALLTEEHTKNSYYWENVATLKNFLEGSGFDVEICFPKELAEPLEVVSISGQKMVVLSAVRNSGNLIVNDKKIDLIVCNNDFSKSYSEWVEGLETPMNPPFELGWYRRKKSQFFTHYNQLAGEFSQLIGLPPNLIQVETWLFEEIDVNDDSSRERLAERVDEFLAIIKGRYLEQGIETDPFVFIKNNSGTYGLGVLEAHSGDEIRSWNYKSRKTMKAVKGGGSIQEVIIQEGIPTQFTSKDESAEPAIYMIGCQVAGGFLRTHASKGPSENLNSPGVVFKRLCVSDLEVNIEGCPMENVYGWLARLGLLAISYEARDGGVEFKGFKPISCS